MKNTTAPDSGSVISFFPCSAPQSAPGFFESPIKYPIDMVSLASLYNAETRLTHEVERAVWKNAWYDEAELTAA